MTKSIMWKEEGILLLSALYTFYRISSEETSRQLWCLILITVSSCLVEGKNTLNIPKRNSSYGISYGLILIPGILFEMKLNSDTETSNFQVFKDICDDGITFSLWTVGILVFCDIMPDSLDDKVRWLLAILLSGLFIKFGFCCNLSVTVISYLMFGLCSLDIAKKYLPNCFTFGELFILVQMFLSFVSYYFYSDLVSIEAMLSSRIIIFVSVFIPTIAFVQHLGMLSDTLFYITSAVGISLLLISIVFFMPTNMVKWLIKFLCDRYPYRQALLIFWVSELAICAGYLAFRSNILGCTTSERKLFHIFILLTYIPGILFDIPLLVLGSIAATALLLLLELTRVFNLTPLAPFLEEKFGVFRDSQDSGCLILTPLYLILGQSLPVWVIYFQKYLQVPISIYSGIFSVGIGDTMASVIGSKYGRLKWPGSNKTVEGTLAAIASQILFAFFISGPSSTLFNDIALAIVTISLLEAFTNQIDNLVLPVFMYFLLNCL